MKIKHLFCGSSLLLLSSCASKRVDLAPLPPITRIEAKTSHQKPPYTEVKKTLSNANHIARVVAAVDAEKSEWKAVSDGPQVRSSDIDLIFYGSGGEVRQFTVHSSVISGSLGNEWNLAALDTSRGVGAGSGAQRVVKLVSDAQIKALLSAIGPVLPPKSKP